LRRRVRIAIFTVFPGVGENKCYLKREEWDEEGRFSGDSFGGRGARGVVVDGGAV